MYTPSWWILTKEHPDMSFVPLSMLQMKCAHALTLLASCNQGRTKLINKTGDVCLRHKCSIIKVHDTRYVAGYVCKGWWLHHVINIRRVYSLTRWPHDTKECDCTEMINPRNWYGHPLVYRLNPSHSRMSHFREFEVWTQGYIFLSSINFDKVQGDFLTKHLHIWQFPDIVNVIRGLHLCITSNSTKN